MQYLKNLAISGWGEHVDKIRELFGSVYLGGRDEEIKLEITRDFPNYYRTSCPENHEDALLYVVVPDKRIANVWPDRLEKFDGVKIGTAMEGGEILTMAVAIHKGLVTLYLCMTPNGRLITNVGSLGI